MELSEEALTCIVCMDIFDRPVTLACGHSFCFTCAAEMLERKPVCSVCRAFAPASALSVNFSLQALIEKLGKSRATGGVEEAAKAEKIPASVEKVRKVCVFFAPGTGVLVPDSIYELELSFPFAAGDLFRLCPDGRVAASDGPVSRRSRLFLLKILAMDEEGHSHIRVRALCEARLVLVEASEVEALVGQPEAQRPLKLPFVSAEKAIAKPFEMNIELSIVLSALQEKLTFFVRKLGHSNPETFQQLKSKANFAITDVLSINSLENPPRFLNLALSILQIPQPIRQKALDSDEIPEKAMLIWSFLGPIEKTQNPIFFFDLGDGRVQASGNYIWLVLLFVVIVGGAILRDLLRK